MRWPEDRQPSGPTNQAPPPHPYLVLSRGSTLQELTARWLTGPSCSGHTCTQPWGHTSPQASKLDSYIHLTETPGLQLSGGDTYCCAPEDSLGPAAVFSSAPQLIPPGVNRRGDHTPELFHVDLDE